MRVPERGDVGRAGHRQAIPLAPIALLAAAQAVNLAVLSIVVTFSAILGQALAEGGRLVTLPLTLLTVTAAAAVFPLAVLMERWGQRMGLVAGALAGAAGAAVTAAAVVQDNFLLFTAGHAGLGVFQASAMYYRFAAADAAPAASARAVSWVLAGGLAAALLAPTLAAWSRGLVAGHDHAGSFFLIAALLLVAGAILAFLRVRDPVPSVRGRPLGVIVRQRAFVVAVLNAALAYVVMSYVMAAAPLAVLAAGHGADAATGITRWHLIGMFAPSFVTGRLVERWGALRLLVVGSVLLLISAGVAASGSDLAIFRAALLGLGAGWNVLFVASTALLTSVYRPEERARAQGANDTLVLTAAAAATLAAGSVQSTFGWSAINLSVVPLLLIVGAVSLRVGSSQS